MGGLLTKALRMAFEKGSVVYLKSGSPPMTVENEENRFVGVRWFNWSAGKFETLSILDCCLTDLSPAEPSPASPPGRVLNLVPPDGHPR